MFLMTSVWPFLNLKSQKNLITLNFCKAFQWMAIMSRWIGMPIHPVIGSTCLREGLSLTSSNRFWGSTQEKRRLNRELMLLFCSLAVPGANPHFVSLCLSSYLHCRWAELEELEKDKRIHQKIKRFRAKQQLNNFITEVSSCSLQLIQWL